MQVRPRTAAALLALTLVAAACGADTVDPPREQTTSSGPLPSATGPGSSSAAPAAAIPEILEFEAPLLDGGTFRGADYAGKDVAFWFWAPW